MQADFDSFNVWLKDSLRPKKLRDIILVNLVLGPMGKIDKSLEDH